MRKGKPYDPSSMRSNGINEIKRTKHGQNRPFEHNAAATSVPNEVKVSDGVRSPERSVPTVDGAGPSQKEGNVFGPLLWILIPLLAVIIWQIFSVG